MLIVLIGTGRRFRRRRTVSELADTSPADTSPAETSPADTIIAALRRNHDDLAARVREFDGADLTRRSGALKWQVAQVLSHPGSGAEIMLARLRAARTGEEAPGQDFSHSVWGRWNAMDPP